MAKKKAATKSSVNNPASPSPNPQAAATADGLDELRTAVLALEGADLQLLAMQLRQSLNRSPTIARDGRHPVPLHAQCTPATVRALEKVVEAVCR